MDKGLQKYVLDAFSQGYSDSEIQSKLVQSGYSIVESYEAVKALKKKQPRIHVNRTKNLKLFPFSYYILVGVVAMVFFSGAAIIFFSGPDCGNGNIDEGETEDSCCIDVLCQGSEECYSQKCIKSDCGPCQYLYNSRCVDYDCCEDSDCETDERCARNECHTLRCEDCQYAENHACIDYECCLPKDCPTSESCIAHQCIGAGEQTIATEMKSCNYDTDCFDGNPGTKDVCMPRSKLCSNPMWECVDDDNFCPPHCAYHEDEDCTNTEECSRNADCPSSDPCSKGICQGTPKKCIFEAVTACKNDDGCCPESCFFENDNDCEEPLDECETRLDCDDDDPCTDDQCTGSPRACTHASISVCVAGDGCCPAGCSSVSDTDCS